MPNYRVSLTYVGTCCVEVDVTAANEKEARDIAVKQDESITIDELLEAMSDTIELCEVDLDDDVEEIL